MYEKEEIAKVIGYALEYDRELYEEFRKLRIEVYRAYGKNWKIKYLI
jgi:hypothetical protein